MPPCHPSQIADKTRRTELLWLSRHLSAYNLLHLWIAAILLLLIDKLNLPVDMLKKLTPKQKALLAFAVILAGGTIIALLLSNQEYGLALVIMFVLGWMVSEISRL